MRRLSKRDLWFSCVRGLKQVQFLEGKQASSCGSGLLQILLPTRRSGATLTQLGRDDLWLLRHNEAARRRRRDDFF